MNLNMMVGLEQEGRKKLHALFKIYSKNTSKKEMRKLLKKTQNCII